VLVPHGAPAPPARSRRPLTPHQAAILLSASVAFVSLPLDDLARAAAVLAIFCSAASMASAGVAVLRGRLDGARAAILAGGEGLMARAAARSAPLVLLAWGAAALATGATLYAMHAGTRVPRAGGAAQWAVACTLGGVVGVLLTSVVCIS
jgi:hypothetical protein